jgi:exopolysaccharide biosynthesis protein
VQAFPVLVAHGEPAFTNTRGDGLSRRTVIAVDDDGYVLWIVSSSLIGLRLTELSAYLPTANLGIVDAFNLDGGGSTLLYIAPDDTTIPSFDAVPAVLAIYPKP